ncbi:MAG: hypothetical protein A3F75_10985 [Betaproteobacteria bacterium RIFCSPLOWO2_12_FULL_64_23]|nr:MAG: hypothetical protein A3F75_10985 [Betaproteobacteria bacterium RIFCSPLOWO2_12_FULL_64_23]
MLRLCLPLRGDWRGFFCPACGHNAADLIFSQSITGIRNALDALAGIRTGVPDRDTAETTARLIIENGLQSGMTAFQRYAEALYAQYPSLSQPRRNAFQNLSEGSDLWYSAAGKRYSDYLDNAELATLARFFLPAAPSPRTYARIGGRRLRCAHR